MELDEEADNVELGAEGVRVGAKLAVIPPRIPP